MVSLKRFTIAESGTLVYRSTGKAYRGEYTLKVTASGVINVYGKNGRRMGTVAAPTTKKAQREIERLDKKRKVNVKGQEAKKASARAQAVYREKQAYKRTLQSMTGFEGVASDYGYANREWAKDKERYFMEEFYGGGMVGYLKAYGDIVTFDQQRLLNFAKVIEDNVNRGIFTVEEGNEYYRRYSDALEMGDGQTPKDIWKEVNNIVKEEFGLPPSDP